MMKLFFLLLSFLGFSQNSSTNDQAYTGKKAKEVPSPTIYNNADDHHRGGGWDGN